MENIIKEKGITWYRFGQKKGALLAREIPFREVFCNKMSKKIKHFPYVINNYKYVDWTHFIDKKDVDLIVGDFSKKIKRVGDLNILLKQSNTTVKSGIKEAKKMDLDKADGNRLLRYFRKFIYFNAKIESYLPCSNFIVRTLSWKVENELQKIFLDKNKDEVKQVAMDLAFSKKPSSFLKRQIDFLKLAAHKNISKKLMHEFIDKYQWVGMVFLIYRPLTIEDVLLEMENINPAIELNRIRKSTDRMDKKRRSLLKQIDNKRLAKLVGLLGASSFVEAEILKNFQLLQFNFYSLLQKMSEHLEIEYKDLIYCAIDEIENVLLEQKKLPSIELLRKRDKIGYSVFIKNGVYKINYTNPQTDVINHGDFVKGICASSGKAVGRVRIIFDVNEMDRVKNGDILVTGMTTPNFVPAMKRAGAIVTNDGGITCHAAIVSRELGVPCIIGTRMATKILKDGDLVEVNANDGTINKLN